MQIPEALRATAQYNGAVIAAGLLLHAVCAHAGAEPDPFRHELSAQAGGLRMSIPAVVTAGVLVDAGANTSRAVLQAEDTVALSGGGLSYALFTDHRLPNWLDRRERTSGVTYRTSWSRYSGDESARAAVAPGGTAVGLVPTKFGAPPAAPRGIFPGAAGLVAAATTDVDFGRLELGAAWRHAVGWLGPRGVLEPGMRLGWSQYDYAVFSADSFAPAVIAPSEVRDRRTQKLQHDIFDFTVGARVQQWFGANDRFGVFARAGATLYFLKATLTSFENYTINGRPQRRFTGGGEREFSLGGEMGLGASWQLASGLVAEVAVDYRPWLPNGRINNPQSGAAGTSPTFLDTESQAQLNAALTLRYRFGRR